MNDKKVIAEMLAAIGNLYLLNDDLFEYKFTKDDINTINEYKLKDYYLKTDIIFDIDYILDLFTNFKFNYVCNVNKNNLKLTTNVLFPIY